MKDCSVNENSEQPNIAWVLGGLVEGFNVCPQKAMSCS